MIVGKKITVVMPAYNAETTLRRTYEEIPLDLVDDVILVDDASRDRTVEVARELGIHCLAHDRNRGYGANQKTCYREALRRGADVVIMLHPDYQYTPKLIPAMAGLAAGGLFDAVLGSRILGRGALRGGMPLYKYLSNRCLTAFQNLMLRRKLTEFHSGYRAFTRRVLETLPLLNNSDDYTFDNQMMTQIVYFGFRIGEVSCPTLYHEEMSSISFSRSVKYGFHVLRDTGKYLLAKAGWGRFPIFDREGRQGLLLGDAGI
ncbi:MAG: glycosyltransferase family 2 protein [Deltaproteobacteria bacterium]|nr:glycosyltransferase family 2 protein [Deltaproteobacteria bacterium]